MNSSTLPIITLLILLSLPLFSVSYGTLQKTTPSSPLTSHIYSPKLLEDYDYSCCEWERRSNVVILKWVISWEWGVVRVALELIPTLEDLSSSDTPLGNSKHLETHLPES